MHVVMNNITSISCEKQLKASFHRMYKVSCNHIEVADHMISPLPML